MSKVTYKYGKDCFSFETELQYDPEIESPDFQLEEHLMMEIKEHKLHLNPQPLGCYIHDVVFQDDNGVIAEVTDFIKLGNIVIRK
jgi:hypothetical protein